MGLIFWARPVPADELAALRAERAAVDDRPLGEDEEDGEVDLLGEDEDVLAGDDHGSPPGAITLDKAWHGLHFLLTGTAWDTSTVLGQAVLGGTARWSPDDDPAAPRLLEPDVVAAVADALARVSDDELRRRFDPAALQQADVHPGIWHEAAVLDTYLLPHLASLRRLYTTAAAHGQGVLARIS